ncbi:MAG: methyltransferase domain-containing protein, partial [Thermococci archaeon]|nr:methyltransferase domain-containing protein [Thermococci archaeon]
LGVEVSPSAVELARENASLNGITNVEFRVSDLFENVAGRFDVVTFNAPYLPGEPRDEIDRALVGGKNGRDVIDRFIREVGNYVRPGGVVQLVQSSITGVDETLSAFRRHGFSPRVAAKLHVFFEDIVLINATRRDSHVFKS